MQLPLVDLVVLILYMAGIVAFGASFYFRSRSSSAYTTGGGRIPAWALGMSIFATFVSSISFLALPGKAYQSNWNGFVFSLSLPIATWVAVKYFVPLFRSINSVSAYAYLETRFGPWARMYASSCYLLTQLARTGSILFLLALPLNALLGWDIHAVIIVTGILTMLYSMSGGIQAVVWTDVVQGFVLIGGALACLLILIFSSPGGLSSSIDTALAHDKFSFGSFDFDWSTSTFWVVLIYGLFINLQNFGIDQNYVQRYVTARTEKDAKFSTWLGGLLYIPVSFMFFLIGTFLFTYYQANPGSLPQELSAPEMSDRIFPYFIVNELPVGFTGLLIAAVFAAGMSTISTSLNSGASVIFADFYQRFAGKEVSEKKSMKVLYISSAAIAVAGIAVGLAMTKVRSALDAWWALSSIFSGGMLGLLLLGYISKKATSMHAAIGVVTGLGVICWISLFPSGLHANMAIVLGTMAIFIVGFLLGMLFKKSSAITVIAFLMFSCSSLPPLATVGGAYVSSELIYPLDNKPTPECHASTIVETPSGIVAAFFAGTHEKHEDVGIRVTHYKNGQWTKPVEVVNGVQNSSLRYPTWNPVLFLPKGGPLYLFYKVGPDPRSWWGMMMTSNDDGKTWSAPAKIGEDPKVGHLLGPVKNKPVQFEDGTIICPSSTEVKVGDDILWKVHFEVSRDNFKTWEVVGPINDGVEFDAIQPSVLRYPDGRLQILCRTRQDVISESWSTDNGKTWSQMKATSLPNPSAGTDAVTLKDGRQLLVYNHTTDNGPEPKDRSMLNVAISKNGKQWKPVLTLENVPNESGYSYPAVIQSSDGLVHITYTYNRETVKHVVVDPSKL